MEVSDPVAGKRRVEPAFFSSILRYGPALFPLLALLWTGLLGLDFGMHWDEKYYQIRPVETIISSGIPLPRYYGYPSFDYWLSISALLPDFFINYATGIEPIKPAILQTIDGHAYLLRLRTLYLFISSLSTLWIYLIVMTWRKAPVEAFLASSFFALSWEVAYHSRWIATDGILMQFGTLTILLCLASYHSKRKQGIASLAAVAAGLGFGTKYPGGLLIVPVIATIILDTIAFHSPNALALVDSAGPLTSFFRAIQTQRELLRLHCAFVPLA